jgi:hypothetical protein
VTDTVHPVDAILPPNRLLALGMQRLLVMAVSPITAAFALSRALALPADVTVHLIGAAAFRYGPWQRPGVHLRQYRSPDGYPNRAGFGDPDVGVLRRIAAGVFPLPEILPRPRGRH